MFIKTEEEGACKNCGKPTPYENIKIGYRQGCCTECTNIIRYGVDNVFKSEKIKQKIKQTNIQKYGVPNAFQNTEIQQRAKETWLQKYGVDNPSKNEDVKQKIKNTNKKLAPIYQKKAKETKLKKYGNAGYTNQEQARKTTKERYGEECYFLTEEFQQKYQETCLQRYGARNYKQSEQAMLLWQQQREQIEKEFNCTFYRDICNYEQLIRSNIPYLEKGGRFYILNEYIPYMEEFLSNCVSTPELRLKQFISTLIGDNIDVFFNCRTVISPLELDVYIPTLNLAIEFNGTYWHSNKFVQKEYHLHKSLMCRDKNIRLIHIYEFEDVEYQKQLLEQLILYNNDVYSKKDFNKNNLIKTIPQPEIIYKDNNIEIYGAGKLY